MDRSNFIEVMGALGLCLVLCLSPSRPARADSAPVALTNSQRHQADSEIKQGDEVAAEIAKMGKLVKDSPEAQRVETIGQRIAAIANVTEVNALYGSKWVYPYKWHFNIIKDKDINAFSIPGGYVYINSGLLERVRSDDELAGVLGHEITHVAHHHISAMAHEQSKMTSQMLVGMLAAIAAHVSPRDMGNLYSAAGLIQMGLLNTKYGQSAERDADHGGTIFMQKAGFNAAGMLTFMELLQDTERRSPSVELGILRDHPVSKDRVAAIRAQLVAMGVPLTTAVLAKVSGAARATVNIVSPTTSEVMIATQSVATLADPQGLRGRAAAALINQVMDQGLQTYQVKAENGTLIAANIPILQFNADESFSAVA